MFMYKRAFLFFFLILHLNLFWSGFSYSSLIAILFFNTFLMKKILYSSLFASIAYYSNDFICYFYICFKSPIITISFYFIGFLFDAYIFYSMFNSNQQKPKKCGVIFLQNYFY